ncbi:MAG: VanZ family protein [Acidobacteria bacterium]|nr:VanZ family protein [Acidobacteriota bacterium]
MGVYTVFLYSTLSVAYDIYVWFYDRLGLQTMSQVMSLAYVPVGFTLLVFVVRRLPWALSRYVAFGLITLGMILALKSLTVPAKRFHFLQYGPLTLLVFDALRFRFQGRHHYLCAFGLVALIGLGDEAIQAILPQRHFGVQDLLVNSAAGLMMLLFIRFVVGEEQYGSFFMRQ